jgi:Acetyltransferases
MIRKSKLNELDTIMNIWLETNMKAHDFIDKSYWQGNYEMVKEVLPKATLFVYEENNSIHGFIGLMDNYIAGIFIRVESQSMGIGKALLDYVKEKNTELTLHVYKKNTRAVKFYLREDFTVNNEQIDENTGEVELLLNWRKEEHKHHQEDTMNMNRFNITKIQEHKELVEQAAEWFHEKWGIPKSAYLESMEECLLNNSAVPQWYVVRKEQTIIAGFGVIQNDFHIRKDLTPNVCAVYVEEAYRNQGIAGAMLQFACDEYKNMGINTLYLITDHTSFYERYEWEFLCLVQCEGESNMTRMYRKQLVMERTDK